MTGMSLITTLRGFLADDAVLTGAQAHSGYTEDFRGRYRGAAACVVLPSTTEQVAQVVRAAVQHGVPVLPQGGNTSLCGGAIPDGAGPPPVIVNLARMRRIRRLDPADNSIEVEAG